MRGLGRMAAFASAAALRPGVCVARSAAVTPRVGAATPCAAAASAAISAAAIRAAECAREVSARAAEAVHQAPESILKNDLEEVIAAFAILLRRPDEAAASLNASIIIANKEASKGDTKKVQYILEGALADSNLAKIKHANGCKDRITRLLTIARKKAFQEKDQEQFETLIFDICVLIKGRPDWRALQYMASFRYKKQVEIDYKDTLNQIVLLEVEKGEKVDDAVFRELTRVEEMLRASTLNPQTATTYANTIAYSRALNNANLLHEFPDFIAFFNSLKDALKPVNHIIEP